MRDDVYAYFALNLVLLFAVSVTVTMVSLAKPPEPFVTDSIHDICKIINMENIESMHGPVVKHKLEKMCSEVGAILERPDTDVCVTGCDIQTLCGIPMLEECSTTDHISQCDMTISVLYPTEIPENKHLAIEYQPRFYKIRRGSCVSIDVSAPQASWPLCSHTPGLFNLLTGFPYSLRAYFSEGRKEAAFPDAWSVTFVPGRKLRLPVQNLERPPSMYSPVHIPPVFTPVFGLETTSIYPGDPPRDSCRLTNKTAIQQILTRTTPPEMIVVTFYGKNVVLDQGMNYNDAKSPVSDATFEKGTNVYLSVMCNTSDGKIHEAREILRLDSGGFQVHKYGVMDKNVNFEIAEADDMWLGFKEYRAMP